MNTNEKLREALWFIKLASEDYKKCSITKEGALDVIYEKACAALALPRRNCDVGNEGEQDFRFYQFCDSHIGCIKCPLSKGVYSCILSWSQMPYEKGENNEQ